MRAQSGTQSLKLSNGSGRRTRRTTVHVAVWSNIIIVIHIFYNKNCPVINLEVVGWGIYLTLWKCGFYGGSLFHFMMRVLNVL